MCPCVNHLLRPISRALLWLAAVVLPHAPCQARIWTDVTGRTIDAEFVSSDGTAVVLRSNSSGREINVPLERLSLPDKATALFRLHEEKARLAKEAGVPASPMSPEPAEPGELETSDKSGGRPEPAEEAPAFDLPGSEEELKEFIGDTGEKEPDVIGGFTSFAQPLEIGQYGSLLRALGWPAFLLGILFQIVLAVLIAAVGIHITSIFLDFKETFGTALMVAMGSTGFRALIEYSQAVMVEISPPLRELVESPLVHWMTIIGVIYPFDAFLIRRIYRADMGTAMRAAVAYVLWGRVVVLLIGVLLAAAVTTGGGGDVALPPGLGE